MIQDARAIAARYLNAKIAKLAPESVVEEDSVLDGERDGSIADRLLVSRGVVMIGRKLSSLETWIAL